MHQIRGILREDVNVVPGLEGHVAVLRKPDGDEDVPGRELSLLDQRPIHELHAFEAGAVELFHV